MVQATNFGVSILVLPTRFGSIREICSMAMDQGTGNLDIYSRTMSGMGVPIHSSNPLLLALMGLVKEHKSKARVVKNPIIGFGACTYKEQRWKGD